MNKYAKVVSTIGQEVPIIGRESEMVKTRGGGYAFRLTPMEQFARFLVLGSPNTYYVDSKTLTLENAKVIIDLASSDEAVNAVMLLDSMNSTKFVNGETIPAAVPGKETSVFALGIFWKYGNVFTKKAVYDVIRRKNVLSTLRQLFEFMNVCYMLNDGKLPSSSGFKRAVSNWLIGDGISTDERWVAMQLAKYRNSASNGHSINARDLLRVTHIKPPSQSVSTLFKWINARNVKADTAKEVLVGGDTAGLLYAAAFEKAQYTDSVNDIVDLINEYGLTHEMIPNYWFSDSKPGFRKDIWRALLGVDSNNKRYHMPYTALVRNITRLSHYGVLEDLDALMFVLNKLRDSEALIKARIHPIRLFSALRIYEQGQNREMTWNVNGRLSATIEDAFYESFGAVGRTGKRQLVALDISGSMESWVIDRMGITPREATAVLSMVLVRNEDLYDIIGFSSDLIDLGKSISPNMRIAEVIKNISGLPFGYTDISLPAKWAKENRKQYDAITIMTDNDLNSGYHPTRALRAYRESVGIDVRQIVVGMVSSGYTVSDPSDPLQMDVVGFSADAPIAMTQFIKGEI